MMVGLMLGSSLQVTASIKNAPVRMIPENFSALAKDASPAVVHIGVEKSDIKSSDLLWVSDQ